MSEQSTPRPDQGATPTLADDPERIADLRAYAYGCPPTEWVMDADGRDIIAALLDERDVWYGLAQTSMTLGFALGFRAHLAGERRPSDQTRGWLMGFDASKRAFGVMGDDEEGDA